MARFLRQDTAILDTLVEIKAIDMVRARFISGLPLICIPNPDKEICQYPDWANYYHRKDLEMVGLQDFFFEKFAVVFTDTGLEENRKIYCVVEHLGDNKFTIFYAITNSHSWGEIYLDHKVTSHVPGDTAGTYGIQAVKSWQGPRSKLSLDEEDALAKMCVGLFNMAGLFGRFNMEQHRYVCQVCPKSKKQPTINRKSVLAALSGPSIIYLDRMPTTIQEEEQVRHFGTCKGTFVGERRAYRKTLRAERFKNHEKYLVEKGVYVRSAWVGSRSVEINGNVYTFAEKTAI